jgi:hypothetical protein
MYAFALEPYAMIAAQASVELYVTHTGLMWENARAFGAMMVFAEHRYQCLVTQGACGGNEPVLRFCAHF